MSLTMAAAGGALIGLAAVWLYLSLGRIAGISGIAANALHGLLRPLQLRGASLWPVFFVVGLAGGGWLAYWLLDMRVGQAVDGAGAAWLIAGGILVGFGTRLGSGCTSGHGVCGISRFSVRSLVATVSFLAVGMLTATAIYWVSA